MGLQKVIRVIAMVLSMPVLTSAEAQAERKDLGHDTTQLTPVSGSTRSPGGNESLVSNVEIDARKDGAMSLDRTAPRGNKEGGLSRNTGNGSREAEPRNKQLPSLLSRRPAPIREAYSDASGILTDDNSCSRFFGGAGAGLEVLTNMIERSRLTKLDTRVGIRMSGSPVSVTNKETGLSYRLFGRVEVNAYGPFNTKQRFPTDEYIPHVGSFPPATREVRVLMLLHELGHLMKGSDGNWLLPDDGNNEEQSRKNNLMIESQCGDQIKGLRNSRVSSKLFTRGTAPGAINDKDKKVGQ